MSHINESWHIWIFDYKCCMSLRSRATHTNPSITRVGRALKREDIENGTAVTHAHEPTHTYVPSGKSPSKREYRGKSNCDTRTRAHAHLYTEWRQPLQKETQRIGQSWQTYTHTHTHAHTHTRTHVYTTWRAPLKERMYKMGQLWHTHTFLYRVERTLKRGDTEKRTVVTHAHPHTCIPNGESP